MWIRTVILLGLNLLVLEINARDFSEAQCYDPDRIYPFTGTKTAYSIVRGIIERPSATCEPKQVWMFARHGARYPSVKKLKELLRLNLVRDQIIQNHQNKDGQLCSTVVENLKKWKIDPKSNPENDNFLTEQGERDFISLAQRLKTIFPELLKVDQTNIKHEDYVFRATDTMRSNASMVSFAEGLFGKWSKFKPVKAPKKDTLLRLYQHCPKWTEAFETEPVVIELDEFRKGPEIQKLVKDVNDRLGFVDNLKFDQISLMWEMCRYETAWYLEQDSPWCAIFNTEEMKIFEYTDDLDYYYCCSSGREMSKKIGCHVLSNMFENFKKIESGKLEDHLKGVFLFGHSRGIHTFFSVLGIGKDSNPILRNNFAESENRNYRTSILGSFSANVVAVFYRCADDANSPNKVMFYVSENLQSVSSTACKDGLCDWEKIKEEFGSQLENCNTDFCYNHEKFETTTMKLFSGL